MYDPMYAILLPIHIAAGFCCLLAAAAALFTPKGRPWHVWSGRVFFWGMAVIFVTALPMTLLRPNLFLFLVAIFSFYLALTGWRSARNRSGRPAWTDWTAAGVMTAAGAGMLVSGTGLLVSADTLGLVLLAFGGLGGGFGLSDWRRFRRPPLTGTRRIAVHLTRMLGGTTATVTAFVVTNVSCSPPVVLWLAPTVVFVPVIIYWNRAVLKSARGTT